MAPAEVSRTDLAVATRTDRGVETPTDLAAASHTDPVVVTRTDLVVASPMGPAGATPTGPAGAIRTDQGVVRMQWILGIGRSEGTRIKPKPNRLLAVIGLRQAEQRSARRLQFTRRLRSVTARQRLQRLDRLHGHHRVPAVTQVGPEAV